MANQEKRTILPYTPSTLETIDYAMFEWMNETIDVFCTTNEGWKKVPCIWVAGERSGQRANQIRARDGMLNFPLMTIERSAFTKDPTRKGTFWGNVPAMSGIKGGSIDIARRIKPDKTANFLNADHSRKNTSVSQGPIRFWNQKKDKKVVYETLSIPMPVYLDMTYTINIQSEYQQQMNEIITPFMTSTGGINYFIAKKDGHSYECFIQADFAQQNNVASMGEERRIFITSITIKTLGYITGGDKNQATPNLVIRENAVEVKIPRERVIYGDEVDWLNGKYRE